MKCSVSTACVFSVLIAASYAAPLLPGQLSANLQIGGSTAASGSAPSGGGLTEVLSSIDIPGLLRSVNSIVKIVGVFCPPLSQVLDNVIQNVTSTAFRVFGRAILRNGISGGSGGGSPQTVNVVLPTFPPDEDDYDDEDESTSVAPGSDGNLDLRIATTSEKSDTVSPAAEENAISKRHVRVVREADDQVGAESAPEPAEDLSDVDVDDTERNKRFLPFGGSLSASGSGGSGNFLFDIIRLFAGSGATEESDEKANAPGGIVEVDVSKAAGADGYTEGIPGPITRLFVVANRGIANLVQDLILRLAQTSERLVNFKARLITSLI